MLGEILIGIAIVCFGALVILVRRPFFRMIIRGTKRFYGQPMADMYEHAGVKGVTIAGIGMVAFGILSIVVAVFAGS